jgi:hypothetical protein
LITSDEGGKVMIRSAIILVGGLALTLFFCLSCDDISSPPRDPRAVIPPSQPKAKETPAPKPKRKPKSKKELIQLYFFIKGAKKALEEKAEPMIPLKEAGDREFNRYWPGWKKFTSDAAPGVLVRIETYSPAGLELPPDHPQVLLWLALKDLNQEFEMFNRFFSIGRALDPDIPKALDEKLEGCYQSLEAYQDTGE